MPHYLRVIDGNPPNFRFEEESDFNHGNNRPTKFFRWSGSPKVAGLVDIPKSAIQTDQSPLWHAFWLGKTGVVNARIKDIIEEFEPDVHEFFPITLKQSNGVPYDEPYYIFHVTQRVACVFYKKSARGPIVTVKIGPLKGMPAYFCAVRKLVISKSAFGDRKIFSPSIVGDEGGAIFDDKIVRRLKAEGLLRKFWVHKVTEVDEPWIAEEQVPELIDFMKKNPHLSLADRGVHFEPL